MLRLPSHTSPFPYTTLFRSQFDGRGRRSGACYRRLRVLEETLRLLQRFRPTSGLGEEWHYTLTERGAAVVGRMLGRDARPADRKSTRLNSSHTVISYAVFCL